MTTTTDAGVDLEAMAICREWMAHLGYTPEEITEAEADRDHTECWWTEGGWDCSDDFGKTRHPVSDEMDQVAELVLFVLERVRPTDPHGVLPAAAAFLVARAATGDETVSTEDRFNAYVGTRRGLLDSIELTDRGAAKR